MHELSIAESLISIVEEEVARHSLQNVTSVKIKVGKLTAVQPEALSSCFELLTENSSLNGVWLDIEMLPIKGYCEDCRQHFELERPFLVCPKCQGWNVRMEGGHELYVDEIETE
ncbi:MAG: hydrogenase maturation nickel metallochaperone HypA [Deltaproteobacteria bacterium]|nr:MAG: hydrogenase maturation nickel metallochaperone HypA [Deltaproteobacteria bacterium]